jgi:hypothetical protein
MDESILRNLDTQLRRLAEIEAEVDRLLAGTDPAGLPSTADAPQHYHELTATNDALRAEQGWTTLDLDAVFTAEMREQFGSWRAEQRLPWAVEDLVVVAVAGLVGVAATWFDDSIDSAVRKRLEMLAKTDLIRRWDRETHRLPIDYMGPGFGGQHHRVRSAGHDIGRLFEALKQIRSGTFHGYRWEDGVRLSVSATAPRPGAAPYRTDIGFAEALAFWGKHLAADFVTTTNLPLPGWTRLYELPSRQIRTFAHTAFQDGLNLRFGLITTLPLLTTEVIIRSHVHGRAMIDRGSAELRPDEETLRTELLLAAHALVGAASLGKAVTRGLAAPVGGITAVRHVNWPVLMRAATLSARVAADARSRRVSGAPEWDELLATVAGPWQLDVAAEVELLVART